MEINEIQLLYTGRHHRCSKRVMTLRANISELAADFFINLQTCESSQELMTSFPAFAMKEIFSQSDIFSQQCSVEKRAQASNWIILKWFTPKNTF